ncbi:hypothetical protein C7H19_15395 [Aphanothece hegewaldii CCALA 016]|uniref:Lipoprotein n=1 Tax=Aphanothece hegewaldii CCALA 016 TaxID=2107694 RepID=A0A2T1LVQ1_9CHRO|nr:hypothetical protein [Aphanothece hegewaldii]PSF35808.1 hypothetical protein C7H19_15395 [Aphanothece hegewaldii CCALA 016]
MKLKIFVNQFILIAGLSLLQSCQFVTAQSDQELNFIPIKEWGTLGKAPKGLLEQFKLDNQEYLQHWVGDPKRFLVQTYRKLGQKTVFIIDPRSECLQIGCADDRSIYFQYYAPFCGGEVTHCKVMFYVEDNKKFHSVSSANFVPQGDGDEFLFALSEQQQNGLPLCWEVKGYPVFSEEQISLPVLKQDERYVSRYCYNGQKYKLNKIYTERWSWVIQLRESYQKK